MRQLLVTILVVLVILVLLNPQISYYSAVDLYKDVSGGQTLANPMTGFLQEDTKDMMTQPYNNDVGMGFDYDEQVRQYPFGQTDEFDYTKSTNWDYASERAILDVNQEVEQVCKDPRECPDVLVQNMFDYKELSDANIVLKDGQTVPIKDLLKIKPTPDTIVQ